MIKNKYHGHYVLEFHYRTEDCTPIITHLAKRPKAHAAMMDIILSAEKGDCVKDCGPCGGRIKSDEDLIGVAFFHGSDDRVEKELIILSPICAKCYEIGRDILETRFAHLIREKLFGGEAELGFSSNPSRAEH